MRGMIRPYRRLRTIGEEIGRVSMSERAREAIRECDGSCKGVMILAGRLKAIAHMAGSDPYWSEQVEKGFQHEIERGSRNPATEKEAR